MLNFANSEATICRTSMSTCTKEPSDVIVIILANFCPLAVTVIFTFSFISLLYIDRHFCQEGLAKKRKFIFILFWGWYFIFSAFLAVDCRFGRGGSLAIQGFAMYVLPKPNKSAVINKKASLLAPKSGTKHLFAPLKIFA